MPTRGLTRHAPFPNHGVAFFPSSSRTSSPTLLRISSLTVRMVSRSPLPGSGRDHSSRCSPAWKTLLKMHPKDMIDARELVQAVEVEGLWLRVRDVQAHLRHGPNGQRVNPLAGDGDGALRAACRGHVIEKGLRHLAARRVFAAYEEYPGHKAPCLHPPFRSCKYVFLPCAGVLKRPRALPGADGRCRRVPRSWRSARGGYIIRS